MQFLHFILVYNNILPVLRTQGGFFPPPNGERLLISLESFSFYFYKFSNASYSRLSVLHSGAIFLDITIIEYKFYKISNHTVYLCNLLKMLFLFGQSCVVLGSVYSLITEYTNVKLRRSCRYIRTNRIVL